MHKSYYEPTAGPVTGSPGDHFQIGVSSECKEAHGGDSSQFHNPPASNGFQFDGTPTGQFPPTRQLFFQPEATNGIQYKTRPNAQYNSVKSETVPDSELINHSWAQRPVEFQTQCMKYPSQELAMPYDAPPNGYPPTQDQTEVFPWMRDNRNASMKAIKPREVHKNSPLRRSGKFHGFYE